MKKILLLSFLAAVLITTGYGQYESDSVAIRQLLEKESATWRAGDIKGHADCWVIKPYSRILVSTADGKVIDVPPDIMTNPPSNMIGRGGSSINTNYKMGIYGTNAWVSHNEESKSTDGRKSYSYEIRMLEKINGEWKLVGQSIHIYKPD